MSAGDLTADEWLRHYSVREKETGFPQRRPRRIEETSILTTPLRGHGGLTPLRKRRSERTHWPSWLSAEAPSRASAAGDSLRRDRRPEPEVRERVELVAPDPVRLSALRRRDEAAAVSFQGVDLLVSSPRN